MEERTFTMKYQPGKCSKFFPGEVIPPMYEIRLVYNNKIVEFEGKKYPIKKAMKIITMYKLNEEQEQEVIKRLIETPLNTSIKELMNMASHVIKELGEKKLRRE